MAQERGGIDWERSRERLRVLTGDDALLASFDDARRRGRITQRLLEDLHGRDLVLRDIVVLPEGEAEEVAALSRHRAGGSGR